MRELHRAAARDRPPRKVVAGGGIAVVLAILFWLIFYQNLPGNFGLNGTPPEGPDSFAHTLNRVFKFGMILVSLYVIASRWSVARAFAKYLNPGMVAVLVLIALSSMWSIDQNATISGTTTLASTVLTCFAACLAGWHPRRFQQLAIPPLLAILLISLLVGMLVPDGVTELGTDLSQLDAWHGITLSKNTFAMTASLVVIICVHGWLAREGRALGSIAGAAVGIVCLILSRGNTSQLATLVAVFFMVLGMRVPWITRKLTALGAVGLAGMMLLYELVIQNMLPGAWTLLAPVRAITGKDSTFSSRTQIWDIIKDHILGAPYLGTGYGAYWVGAVESSPSYISCTSCGSIPRRHTTATWIS